MKIKSLIAIDNLINEGSFYEVLHCGYCDESQYVNVIAKDGLEVSLYNSKRLQEFEEVQD